MYVIKYDTLKYVHVFIICDMMTELLHDIYI